MKNFDQYTYAFFPEDIDDPFKGSFTRLYQGILSDLLTYPEHVIAPRGLKINELVNVSVEVNPSHCHIDFTKTGAPERHDVYAKYCLQELEWYLSGNTLASSAPSKFWNQLAGLDGHITSNYGHMMLFDKKYPAHNPSVVITTGDDWDTAIDRVVKTLVADPDSRQAIVHYNEPRHCYPQNKDFPCTVYSQFFVRDGKLSMTTYQRSCDIIKGFSYDVPWNCYFMRMVLNELNAKGLKVEEGTFTHVFGSLHLYHKDLDLAKRIVSEPEVVPGR